MRWLLAFCAAVFALLVVLASPARSADKQLWVYCPTNLAVAENVDKLDALFDRAQAAGYTHVLLHDSKFARLGGLEVPQTYFDNARRLMASAERHRLQLVPAIFGIGYSNSLLWHDPNLAEGVPVLDTPLIVRDGRLVVEQGPAARLQHLAFKDATVQIGDDGVATLQNPAGNARFVFALHLPKFRAYHVSVMIAAEGFTGTPEIKPLAGDKILSYSNLKVQPTQDWRQHDIVFDTLDNEDVNLYFGVWGDATGTLRWKDWKIEEIGFVNVLRRPGTPVTICDEQGRALEEGKDFGPVADPLLGNKPWPGEYTVWHEPPAVACGLPQGTRLRASWYYPPVIYDEQVGICPSEPATRALLEDQARRVDELFHARGYMMSHDEVRVWNQCAACRERHLDAGAMLADNAAFCAALLEGKDVYVWSDMFDPHHNARAGYYLVRGDLAESWRGLPADVTVMNWNFGERDASLAFFADRGNRQVIAGYYDAPLDDAKAWLAGVAAASPPVRQSVTGFMYTTWTGDYGKLEDFARLCRGGGD